MITRRLVNLWRAIVGSGLTELEADHAEAMLDLQRTQLQDQVRKFNLGLAAHAGLCERLKAQIARLDGERTSLEARLHARLAVDDRGAAGLHALRIEAIDAERAREQTQLAEAEAQYAELLRARKVALHSARERIEGLKRSIGDYQMQKALADLSEMAADMHGAIGLSDGTLQRVEEKVQERRHLEAGRVRVARESMDTTDLRAREAEQAALAEAALERISPRRASQAPVADGL